jgi:hypothetical protein
MRLATVGLGAVLLGCGICGAAQEPARATDLPGRPFSILRSWTIGGEGTWDYLAFDATALQLFVTHEQVVQVVDVTTGKVVGEVTGLGEARDVALDDNGQFGYVTDGRNAEVKVFDRRSFQVVASVRTAPGPRSIVFDPATHLVFAVCLMPTERGNAGVPAVGNGRPARVDPRTGRPIQPLPAGSAITVIDTLNNSRLGDLLITGHLGAAQTDGKGQVFVNVIDRSQIAHFDAQTAANLLREHAEAVAEQAEAAKTAASTAAGKAGTTQQGSGQAAGGRNAAAARPELNELDWSDVERRAQPGEIPLHRFGAIAGCSDPAGLAIDSAHLRLFVDCSNGRLAVLDAIEGRLIAMVKTGAQTDAIGYDPGRGLIYVASTAVLGSLTVIHQSVTDSYDVVQEVPTQARARTLAVNTATGEVYLVTNVTGFDVSTPGVGGGTHTLPVVQSSPVKGTFHVLVIGTEQ